VARLVVPRNRAGHRQPPAVSLLTQTRHSTPKVGGYASTVVKESQLEVIPRATGLRVRRDYWEVAQERADSKSAGPLQMWGSQLLPIVEKADWAEALSPATKDM